MAGPSGRRPAVGRRCHGALGRLAREGATGGGLGLVRRRTPWRDCAAAVHDAPRGRAGRRGRLPEAAAGVESAADGDGGRGGHDARTLCGHVFRRLPRPPAGGQGTPHRPGCPWPVPHSCSCPRRQLRLLAAAPGHLEAGPRQWPQGTAGRRGHAGPLGVDRPVGTFCGALGGFEWPCGCAASVAGQRRELHPEAHHRAPDGQAHAPDAGAAPGTRAPRARCREPRRASLGRGRRRRRSGGRPGIGHDCPNGGLGSANGGFPCGASHACGRWCGAVSRGRAAALPPDPWQ
mmetsp:Transcript_7722/g.24180  ORF Transcript_7722/g.24180 Transcript_7722/m.24180 type:complete len:290 (-) Transcript_7722:1489-2358(-)